MLDQLMKLIKQYDEVGTQLNEVLKELREKEFQLKNKKLKLEFSKEFEHLRDGLKVKEIPYMINNQIQEESQLICDLKAKRDDLTLELECTKLQIEYTKEVINSTKQ